MFKAKKTWQQRIAEPMIVRDVLTIAKIQHSAKNHLLRGSGTDGCGSCLANTQAIPLPDALVIPKAGA